MPIVNNGTTMTTIKNNTTVMQHVIYHGTVVHTASSPATLKWQFVAHFSSEPGYYDLNLTNNLNDDYEQGLSLLNNNYPAGNYYEGFDAVIFDPSSDNYFEYVVVYN